MKRDWPWRQLLAALRGMVLMVALLLSLILLQLAPSLIRGGISGVRDHIERVAVAGVPPEHWGVAITRMYEALATIVVIACLLFLAQRFLARRLASGDRMPGSVATQVSR